MRKVKLSDEQLSRILRLRQTGASWLKIQRETGIPRRSAKNIYESWTSSQTQEELKAARKEVATEEFKIHLNDLLMIAKMVVDYLPDSLSINDERNSAEIINHIWTMDPYPKEKVEEVFLVVEKSEKKLRRIIRRNKLLFDSLKEHTCDKLSWQALDEWKVQWDRAVETQSRMKEGTRQLLSTILKGQRKDITRLLEKSTTKNEILQDMINGVYEAAWRSVCAERLEEANEFVRKQKVGTGNTSIFFGEKISNTLTIINLGDTELAEGIYKICIQAAESIGRSDITRCLLDIKQHLEKKALEIEVMLDEICLRPLILRTRCELCPA